MHDSEAVFTPKTPPPPQPFALLQVPDQRLHQHILRALALFGHDRLTIREQHVVQLILLGLSSKVAATRLRIAPKTEGVHRRNAYAKLGVNSQSALFRQFLGFLSTSWAQLEPSDTFDVNDECVPALRRQRPAVSVAPGDRDTVDRSE